MEIHKCQNIVGTASRHRTCFAGGMRKTYNARVSERHAMKEGDRIGGIPQHDGDEEEHVKGALEPPAMAAARYVTEPNCILGRMLWPDKYLEISARQRRTRALLRGMSAAGLPGYARAVRDVVFSHGFRWAIFYDPAAIPPGHLGRVLAFFGGRYAGFRFCPPQMRRNCDANATQMRRS